MLALGLFLRLVQLGLDGPALVGVLQALLQVRDRLVRATRQSQGVAHVVERVPVVHAARALEHRDRLALQGDRLVVVALVREVEGLVVQARAGGRVLARGRGRRRGGSGRGRGRRARRRRRLRLLLLGGRLLLLRRYDGSCALVLAAARERCDRADRHGEREQD